MFKQRPRPKPIYNDDLAFVHNAGYGFHWQNAAPAVLKWLRLAKIQSGTIVDLGCGGGQWLARLSAEGYSPIGVDCSVAMVERARKSAPAARLIHGSLADVELPECTAVTSLGEPLNYLSSERDFRRTLKNVYQALQPGGLFIFDVRIPADTSIESRVATRQGDDWACIAIIDERPGAIVRRITTFCKRGTAYRRSEEVHRLKLYRKSELVKWLSQLGFQFRFFRGYGDYKLQPRHIVCVARKSI